MNRSVQAEVELTIPPGSAALSNALVTVVPTAITGMPRSFARFTFWAVSGGMVKNSSSIWCSSTLWVLTGLKVPGPTLRVM